MKNMSISGVTTIKGKKPGKTLAIIAGVHGNEICGIKAIEEIKETIEILSGKVHFILGNPKAIKSNIRYVDSNLNRAFLLTEKQSSEKKEDYEIKRAKELIPVLNECDASLDIHSVAGVNTTPFIICEPRSLPIACKLPFSIISYGWDKIEPGGTDYYMNQKGKYGICVECGYHDDPNAVSLAKNSITQFLSFFEVIDPKFKEQYLEKQKITEVFFIYKTQKNFKPIKKFTDFEPVLKGQLIGYDSEEKIFSEQDGLIVFVRERNRGGEEAFILGRTKHLTN